MLSSRAVNFVWSGEPRTPTAASFHCLVEEWKDCEEPKPQPKEKLIFVVKKREVRHSLQISVHEMWKRQQVHADERNMYRTEILGKEFGKME